MLISYANSANSIAVIRFSAQLEISVDYEGKHGQSYCNCQTGYCYKLKLEPVKPVENQSGEDNENPQHFIHEINTIAYDVINIIYSCPPLMRFLPKLKGLTGPSYTTDIYSGIISLKLALIFNRLEMKSEIARKAFKAIGTSILRQGRTEDNIDRNM